MKAPTLTGYDGLKSPRFTDVATHKAYEHVMTRHARGRIVLEMT
jgi:hypothetical protein